MPQLSQTEAYNVGPTVDTDAELKAMKFRQEPHELPVMPANVSLRAAKPRPLTHKMDHSLHAAQARVLTRQGNINPANAGRGNESSVWGLSDPFFKRSFLGNAEAPKINLGVTLAIGIGLGVASYLIKGSR